MPGPRCQSLHPSFLASTGPRTGGRGGHGSGERRGRGPRARLHAQEPAASRNSGHRAHRGLPPEHRASPCPVLPNSQQCLMKTSHLSPLHTLLSSSWGTPLPSARKLPPGSLPESPLGCHRVLPAGPACITLSLTSRDLYVSPRSSRAPQVSCLNSTCSVNTPRVSE